MAEAMSLGGAVPEICVVHENFLQIPADVFITSTDASGVRMNGINEQIKKAVGYLFHSKIAGSAPLVHEKTIISRGDSRSQAVKFSNMIFVVDELRGSVSNIARAGLGAAADAGFSTVLLEPMRSPQANLEKTLRDVYFGIVRGVDQFEKKYTEKGLRCPITKITLVTANALSADLFKEAIKKALIK